MIIDFRNKKTPIAPVTVNGEPIDSWAVSNVRTQGK
jgi:hypothetical protein